jgi:D-methionine transport system substrate-binding protein
MSAIPPTNDSVVLPPKRSNTGKIIGIIAAIVVVIVAAVLIVVNLNKPADDVAAGDSNAITSGLGSPDEPVQIGVVGASDPYWSVYADAAEAEGIAVEIVDFAEYNQPNPALTEGELDLNQFQHLVYLAQYNVDAGEDLTPIGSTAIYPLGLYSDKYDDVDDITDGDTVAVPNDPSNLARALGVLQSAGLIELTTDDSTFATLADVDTDASRVTITALEPSLTASSLPDVAAAIVNNDFLEPAGLKGTDALAQDDPENPAAKPYINVFVSTAENKDNEVLNRLVEIYQNDQAVLDGVVEQSGGTAIITKTPVDDLVATLKEIEENVGE